MSPLCPHFLKTSGSERVLRGSKGLEKTKVRGQEVDKIRQSHGSQHVTGKGRNRAKSGHGDGHKMVTFFVTRRDWKGS